MDINKSLKYIEIETCSQCTRKCKWCLFGNYERNEMMENKYLDTHYINKIIKDLKEMNFSGTIALYGINEPLLDERICDGSLLKMFREELRDKVSLNIVTNGDLLDLDIINILFESGLNKLTISCYDDDSYKKATDFKSKFTSINILDQRRYHLGMWESNRGGAIGNFENDQYCNESCYMPFFRIVVGWNGEIRICPHDILGIAQFGNIKEESIIKILSKPKFVEFRNKLLDGRGDLSPCKKCNVDGSLEYMLKHLNNKKEVKDILHMVKINKNKLLTNS